MARCASAIGRSENSRAATPGPTVVIVSVQRNDSFPRAPPPPPTPWLDHRFNAARWPSRYVIPRRTDPTHPTPSWHPADRLPQWKSFDFFDVSQVALPDEDTHQLFESNEISSVCAGSDSLFVGSNDGSVSIIGKSWKVVSTFQAHDSGRITHMRQVEGTSVLVTIAVSTRVRAANTVSLAVLTASAGGPEQRAGAQGLGLGQAG